MSLPVRIGLGLALLLAGAVPERARAEILMSVNGPNGPFSGLRGGNSVKVLNVALDFSGATATAAGVDAKTSLKPVLVTKPVDRTSWEFLDALATSATLDVVISIVPKSSEEGVPARRVVTLSNAKVAALHDAMDAKIDPSQGLGVETISFTYERIQIEDDGYRVFAAGP
jgi:type VI secretion system Hcp family effector